MQIIIVQSLQALLPHPPMSEISLSAVSAYVPSSKCETKFHTDTKNNRQNYSSLYLIFKFLNSKLDDR